MGRYCASSDCIARYNRLQTVADSATVLGYLDSHHIYFAENELDARLSPVLTVPFSSNNITAKDLAIDMTFLRAGNLKAEERKELLEQIDSRIKAIMAGKTNMITTSGDAVASVGGTVWSNTMGYTPTFGSGDIEDFVTDTDLIDDEQDARE